jgi:hypothetical protein
VVTGKELYDRGRDLYFTESPPWEDLPEDAKRRWEANAIHHDEALARYSKPPRGPLTDEEKQQRIDELNSVDGDE